jgi:hypothetical protein
MYCVSKYAMIVGVITFYTDEEGHYFSMETKQY